MNVRLCGEPREALREYIARREQATIVELFGKVEMVPEYDYKEHRRRR